MSHETGMTVRDAYDGDDIEVDGSDYDTTQIESDADEAPDASGSAFVGLVVGWTMRDQRPSRC
jgi:hypothetical protein